MLARHAWLLFGGIAACGSEPSPRAPAPSPSAPGAPLGSSPQGLEPVPTETAPAATLSLPSGLDFSCQSEAQCLAHRCNLTVGKCVWPCRTDVDCQPGFMCLPPACLPRLGN